MYFAIILIINIYLWKKLNAKMVDYVMFTYNQILSCDDNDQILITRNIINHHDPGLRIMCPSRATRLPLYFCLS